MIANNQDDAANETTVGNNTTEITNLTSRVKVIEDGVGLGGDFSNATDIEIGLGAEAEDSGISIGTNSSSNLGVSVGPSSRSYTHAVALGYEAIASGYNSVAIGWGGSANGYANTVVIGRNIKAQHFDAVYMPLRQPNALLTDAVYTFAHNVCQFDPITKEISHVPAAHVIAAGSFAGDSTAREVYC